jgi:hypothetical protein
MEHPAATGEMDSFRADAHGASRDLHRDGHFLAVVLEKPLKIKKRAKKFSQFKKSTYLCTPLQKSEAFTTA